MSWRYCRYSFTNGAEEECLGVAAGRAFLTSEASYKIDTRCVQEYSLVVSIKCFNAECLNNIKIVFKKQEKNRTGNDTLGYNKFYEKNDFPSADLPYLNGVTDKAVKK